ncbi:cysteine--tRNA ligase [Paenibacillus alvei]|uniref:cysteine--tRNA ligase n=1 Tax=Paenibacillus alvei TaxID=44250 RepID=UPI000288B556|nr:cysteine--tRNA ligase [Paenibacillus alvei]EJW18317.1 cysteine--tRNA ligase CysS [Paenibacillus alvei DSM 29]MCY9541749.1 cysteine--tRNA ligase [Paenibacillus alvei]MCY9705493.1 cysteine--tRNA ligase [Paenibacillus alvei]MCY9735380.1 cysteine--tRNA ligase [Paenibacillus alvei]MCY9758730.1 cysteine--tRNA ligase [Paenibacillus alvei]
MNLHIYNTLTRTKEPFQPIDPDRVTMYVCGPTVYDYIHIGNARPAIFFDVVRRYLETLDYEVNYIVNFTDVDDKLIRKAAELGSTVPEVADRFIQAFYEDNDGLGIRRASNNPRVTDNMEEIIAFISELVESGKAYESGGDVYFRTREFAKYGQISRQNVDELQLGIRIEVDERKEDAADFVLWKAAKPGEISWASPWGEGRPGWHIECSAMSRKYLGETIDIHGGGQDLQFPHHECEAAQSESVTGKPLANVWMHNGYINIDNEKMSKSLGNGVTVQQLRKQYNPGALRYFMLSTHYRNPLNFSAEAMEQAEKSVSRIENAVANVRHALASLKADRSMQEDPNEAIQAKIVSILETFDAKMQDDFNTADAITAVFEWASEANSYLQQSDALAAGDLEALLDAFEAMNGVLGLVLDKDEELLDEEIERLIQERNDARKAKNWARADEIRDLLTEQGIVLEDTPQGVRWRRK